MTNEIFAAKKMAILIFYTHDKKQNCLTKKEKKRLRFLEIWNAIRLNKISLNKK
jgi:hypothetical protein